MNQNTPSLYITDPKTRALAVFDAFNRYRDTIENHPFRVACRQGNLPLAQQHYVNMDPTRSLSKRFLTEVATAGHHDVLAWLFNQYQIPYQPRKYQRNIFDEILLGAARGGSLECVKLAVDPREYPNTPLGHSWGALVIAPALDVALHQGHDDCVDFLRDAQERIDRQRRKRDDDVRASMVAQRLA